MAWLHSEHRGAVALRSARHVRQSGWAALVVVSQTSFPHVPEQITLVGI
jgi:hypothetical protein